MSTLENILLFGGGLQASCCIDIIEKEGRYKIVGIVDSVHDIGTELFGYKVVGRQEQLKELIPEYSVHSGIITIGDNWSRKIVYDFIAKISPDFKFVNAIHPSTIIGKNVKLGVGVVVMAGCIINPDTTLGDFCFLATGAQIEHNCRMEDFSSVSVGSLTGGKVNIGQYSAITLGVTIMDRINIGKHTIVGSGSLVTKDLPDNVLAYGSPAKIVRNRKIGEKYLKSN